MSNGGQQGDDKHSMQILWIIFGVFAICGLIWWGFAPQLKMGFIFVKKMELYFLDFLVKYIPLKPLHKIQTEIGTTLFLAQNINHISLGAESAEELSLVTGKYMSIFYIAILFYFGRKNYVKNIKIKYRRRHSMKTLRDQEQELWPQIKAVSGLNLLEHDLENGPWAMGQNPLTFCKKNKLIKIQVEPPPQDQALKSPTFKMVLNEAKTRKVFAAQLGNLWRGEKSLPPYKRAVLAVLVARGCRDSDKAKKLVHQINSSIDNSKVGILDFSGADELLKKHMKNKSVKRICREHAYESTIFTSLMLFARADGVLPSADFLWVKPLDRRFWYVINNVGRQTAVAEAAGSYAHFLAEKGLGRALSVPYVEEAVKALQIALDEILYIPDEDERSELLEKAGLAG